MSDTDAMSHCHIEPLWLITKKLHGRAFYRSIGSPKKILAPMVDQSEFVWRMLSRSFLPPEARSTLLAYTPMFHARLFAEKQQYRDKCFQAVKLNGLQTTSHLDGNPSLDRPLFVQFCANDPATLLKAAKLVEKYCDAVDLNLGCPQGIARKGHYGSFLQEDWDLVYRLINILHQNLDIPVTAKIRILETKEKTLEYARVILSAGASIITVHARRREQKGHKTGLADWSVIRYLRDNLPPDTVIFANGNILQHQDIERCMDLTGADGIMSAEGNLHDPSIFAMPPSHLGGNEYWIDKQGQGGYRMDAVMRRYLDLVYKFVLQKDPPHRPPLFVSTAHEEQGFSSSKNRQTLPLNKRKVAKGDIHCPNLSAMQSHLFSLLKPLLKRHTEIRDVLARIRRGDLDGYESILQMVEDATREGIIEHGSSIADSTERSVIDKDKEALSTDVVTRCKRPWWICQPYVRPLPEEAFAKGSLQLSKKIKQQQATHLNPAQVSTE